MTLHSGGARGSDVYFLRRFLRARQHDLKKAREMYAASMKWRREFGVDEVAANFHFTERDAFIALYPQGYHKTDKLVRGRAPRSTLLATLVACFPGCYHKTDKLVRGRARRGGGLTGQARGAGQQEGTMGEERGGWQAGALSRAGRGL